MRTLKIVCLIFFCITGFIQSARALILVEPVRALPNESVELFLADTYQQEPKTLVSRYGILGGFTPHITGLFQFDYIIQQGAASTPGDGKIGFNWVGDTSNSKFLYSIFVHERVPSGPKSDSRKWAELSYGLNESVIGLSMRYGFAETALHGMISYSFRQGEENEYFSPQFFSADRMHNDRVTLSAGINNVMFYPFVLSAESRSVFYTLKANENSGKTRETSRKMISIEGAAGIVWWINSNSAFSLHLNRFIVSRESAFTWNVESALRIMI